MKTITLTPEQVKYLLQELNHDLATVMLDPEFYAQDIKLIKDLLDQLNAD